MAKNITYKPGNHISAPVPAGTKSGAPLRIGGLNAVAVTDRAEVGAPAVLADGTKNPASTMAAATRRVMRQCGSRRPPK